MIFMLRKEKKEGMKERGTSQVVQWLRLHTPNAGDSDSVSGQRTRYHMPQLEKKKDKTISWLRTTSCASL